MTPDQLYPLTQINHAIAIAYGKFIDKAQIPTRYELVEIVSAKT